MKTRRFLSLFIAVLLCLSTFSVFADETAAETVINADGLFAQENTVPSKEPADDPGEENTVRSEESAGDVSEELVAMPEDDDDGSIDYFDMSNWAYWDEGEDKTADLFFVCPTVDMGKGGNLIADINNEKYRSSFVGATNMELGIYNGSLNVFAPYYRQATFPVYNFPEEEREVYLDIAYEDVKNAFLVYADTIRPSTPLVLAGFSQGADLDIRLMKDLFDEPEYQRRLVAAYAIGWKLTEDEVKEYPHLVPAQGETDTGVIVTFNSEAPEVTASLTVGENEKTYAINPLNWKTTSEVADKSLNKGACFTEYSGNIKEEIPEFTGAYLDEKRGTLKVTDVDKGEYSSSMFDEGVYHLYDYQFFFRNLEENVNARLSAYNEKYADRIDVYFNDKIICFDVEPVIENGRTLVPFRGIFETMGCAVNYTEQDGKQIVTARRADDVLILTVGEDKMYFGGKEIALDVPAKIKDGRTLVPLRAISEAFECEVNWYGNIRLINIYSPANAYLVSAEKNEEIITDDEGNALIEAVAYYPVIENPREIPCIDTINADYKRDAEKFMEEARAKKADALMLKEQMGEDFAPFVYELTYEQTYGIWGYLSFTNHKYINVGGVHPTTLMESRTYSTSGETELSVSEVLMEERLGASLTEYVTNLFVEKLKETAPESADTFTHDYVSEYLGYIQFYLTKNSVVLYFNQGEIAPYALGVISVEIPYSPELFHVDMRRNYEEELVFEYEYDKGYEWKVFDYSEETIETAVENTDYPPEEILSEYYPAGICKISVKGVKKGNAAFLLACVKKGEGLESATQIYLSSLYVDENNMLTLVQEDDAMFLIGQ